MVDPQKSLWPSCAFTVIHLLPRLRHLRSVANAVTNACVSQHLAGTVDEFSMHWTGLLTSKRLALAAVLFLCLSHSASLLSQTGSDQDAMSLSIEQLAQAKVFSASRHLEDSRQAPSSVSVITAEEIRLYGWRSLGEALRSLRGFYTSYDRTYNYLGVRGFLRPGDYNSRVLLMLNGHRLNDDVYDGAQIGTEFPLDMDVIDHIEIVRGPSSSLFGTNAIFGVINVITRQAGTGNTVEASVDVSSYSGRSGRLTANLERGKLYGLISGSVDRVAGQSRLFFPEFDSPVTNHGIAEDGDGDGSEKIFGDVQYGNLRVLGLFSRRVKLIPTGAYGTIFNDSRNRVKDSRALLDLSYHRSMSLGDVELRAYYDWYDLLGNGVLPGPDGPMMASTWARADWVGTEITLGRQIGRHRIIVGSNYEYSPQVSQRNQIVGQPAYYEGSTQPWLAAVYGEAEINLLSQLSLRAGTRLDHFNPYGSSLSPRMALVYVPNPRTSLKYIYGSAFRAPNAYENGYSDGIVVEAHSISLHPETIESHELILERGLASWIQITVDGSYNHLNQPIDQVPDPATGLSQFVNTGHDRGRSLEFEIQAKRLSGWAARASYTLATATHDSTDDRLANSPLQMAKVNGTAPLYHSSFAGVEFLFASPQLSYHGTRIPASVLTNVTLSTKPVWGGWEFSTSCYNALNRTWYSPAGPELQQSEILQDGRSFRFKVEYRLYPERGNK